MAASVFCVLLELKTVNCAVFFQYFRLSTSYDNECDKTLEPKYETYYVTLHRNGDLTILRPCYSTAQY